MIPRNLVLSKAMQYQFTMVYEKVAIKGKNSFRKSFCLDFAKKRIEEDISEVDFNKIWSFVTGNNEHAVLDKDQTFLFLKIFAALQKKMKLRDILDKIYELDGLDQIKFSTKMKKDSRSTEQEELKKNSRKDSEIKASLIINNQNQDSLNQEASQEDSFGHRTNTNLSQLNLEFPEEKFNNDSSFSPKFSSNQGFDNNAASGDQRPLRVDKCSKLSESYLDPNSQKKNIASTSLDILQSINDRTAEPAHQNPFRTVVISGHEEIKNSYFEKTYVLYTIKTFRNGKSEPFIVKRRYKDFEWLHEFFQNNKSYQGLFIPYLPEKQGITDNIKGLMVQDYEFISRRMADLETYLNGLIHHNLLNKDETLQFFLKETGDFEKLKLEKRLNSRSSWHIKLDSWQNFIETSRAAFNTTLTTIYPKVSDSREMGLIDELMKRIKLIEEKFIKLRDITSAKAKSFLESIAINSKTNSNLKMLELDKKNNMKLSSIDDFEKYLITQEDSTKVYEKNENKIFQEMAEDIAYSLKKIEVAKKAYERLMNEVNELSYQENLANQKKNTYWEKYKKDPSKAELTELNVTVSELKSNIKNIQINMEKELKTFEEGLLKDLNIACEKIIKKNVEFYTNVWDAYDSAAKRNNLNFHSNK